MKSIMEADDRVRKYRKRLYLADKLTAGGTHFPDALTHFRRKTTWQKSLETNQ